MAEGRGRGYLRPLMRLLLVLVLASSALFSCGSTTSDSTCSAATCAGCCTADGQCAGGTETSACGAAGLRCDSCVGAQVCQAGRCETPPPMDPPDAGNPILAQQELWTWTDFADSACGNGSATGVGVNVTTRSKDVLIYMQGGGACWNALTCAFAASNLDGYTAQSFQAEGTLNAAPFNRAVATNPFKDMSYVFVPYCTGDVHAGDSVMNYPGAGQVPARTVHHKGGKNLDVFLQRLKDTFPSAERVFVSGSSAGAFGAQLNFEKIARMWPGAQVHLLADCGQMVTPAGTLLNDWLTNWNVTIPAECVGCATEFEKYPKYLFDKYQASRFGLLAYTQDGTLRQFAGYDAATYEQKTRALLTASYDPSPNAKYFLVPAASHVMLGNLMTLQGPGGVSLLDWTTSFVQGASTLQNVKP